jgi:hypothetical protein
MTEARLHASALMVGAAREEARAEVAAQEGLRVWRLRGPGGESGEAGPLAEPADREAAWARPPEALFELRLGDAHLACITDETPELRSLACIDAAEISRLRAEAGPGRLFAAILAPPLLYVAVEDAEGVIAGSPGLPELSAFEDDLALREVQSEEDPEAVRLRVQPGLREGLAPFALPDGSRAVLRVGLDARLEEAIVTDIRRRHRLVFGAALGAVVLALLAAPRAGPPGRGGGPGGRGPGPGGAGGGPLADHRAALVHRGPRGPEPAERHPDERPAPGPGVRGAAGGPGGVRGAGGPAAERGGPGGRGGHGVPGAGSPAGAGAPPGGRRGAAGAGYPAAQGPGRGRGEGAPGGGPVPR